VLISERSSHNSSDREILHQHYVTIILFSKWNIEFLPSFPENDVHRNQVLKIIAQHREKLAREFGIKSLALFESVVRDEATPASDVDLLVEFDGRPVGLFHLSRTQHYLESILGVSTR
jgi:predicted nucleotidyltransferase